MLIDVILPIFLYCLVVYLCLAIDVVVVLVMFLRFLNLHHLMVNQFYTRHCRVSRLCRLMSVVISTPISPIMCKIIKSAYFLTSCLQ